MNTSGFNIRKPPKFESGKKVDVSQGKHFGKRVIKCGIKTGLTHAACAIDGPRTIQRRGVTLQLPQAWGVRTMYRQYVVTPFKGDTFFDIGDSGSLVFIADDENREASNESSDLLCLGMAIGMDSFIDGREEVYVTPIQDIFDVLGVKKFYIPKSYLEGEIKEITDKFSRLFCFEHKNNDNGSRTETSLSGSNLSYARKCLIINIKPSDDERLVIGFYNKYWYALWKFVTKNINHKNFKSPLTNREDTRQQIISFGSFLYQLMSDSILYMYLVYEKLLDSAISTIVKDLGPDKFSNEEYAYAYGNCESQKYIVNLVLGDLEDLNNKSGDKHVILRKYPIIPIGLTASRLGYMTKQIVQNHENIDGILVEKARCTGRFAAFETEKSKTDYIERIKEDILDIKLRNLLALCRLGQVHATQYCSVPFSSDSDQELVDEHKKMGELMDARKIMDLKNRLAEVPNVSEEIFSICEPNSELTETYSILDRLMKFKCPDAIFQLQFKCIVLVHVLQKLENVLSGLRPYRQERTIRNHPDSKPNNTREQFHVRTKEFPKGCGTHGLGLR